MLAERIAPEVEAEEPWKALPGSQDQFVGFKAHHLLFTGSRGPGKTDAQLFRFRRHVAQGYGRFWRGIIFDREYKNLDDLISKSKRWFPLYDDGAKFLSANSDLKWVWPTGEELLFRAAKTPKDYWNYHGQEFPFIGWNELCKYPTDELYEMMMSCNRASYTPDKDGFIATELTDAKGQPLRNAQGLLIGTRADKKVGLPDPIPLEVVSTTNPYGPGHNWVKRRFITPAPFGRKLSVKTKVYSPAKKEDVIVERTQVTFFGSYRENPYLAPEYVATIQSIKDKNKRKAWLGGSWDIVAGGAIDDVWEPSKQIVPRFVIPENWHIDRAMDWGSTHPCAIGWFAVANGEEVELLPGTEYQGSNKFTPRAGSIIMFDELYLSESIGSNVGLKWGATKVAEHVKQREIDLLETGWILKTPSPGPADNQIFDVRESSTETIAKLMEKVKIYWERSDKAAGSRKMGLQLMRDRFEAVQMGTEQPGLYITNNCRATIDLVPTLPRDEKDMDDVDTTSEDHLYDLIRYRVLKGARRLARKINVTWPT